MLNQEYLPCNCPNYENIEKTINIDHSIKDKPKIIFIDSNTKEVISADKHGCYCNTVLNSTFLNSSSDINKIATDVNKVYWSKNNENIIYYYDKNTNITHSENTDGNQFIVNGSHVQPYPDAKCLIPKLKTQSVSLDSKTDSSITLNLPEIQSEDDCDNISVASVKYKVYFKEYNSANIACPDNCSEIVTYDQTLKISNLGPYTKYIFAISITNYFTDLKGLEEHIGSGIVFQTAAGSK